MDMNVPLHPLYPNLCFTSTPWIIPLSSTDTNEEVKLIRARVYESP